MSQPLIKAENLSTFFPVTGGVFRKTIGHVRAVDGVDLEINPGEIVSVVGESGCGKSTLGNSLLGLVPPTGGRVVLDGDKLDITRPASWKPHRANFQFIFQDPYTSLNPRHTIFEIISEPLLVHGVKTRANVRDGVAEVLEKVGLSADYMQRYPHAFSGGQRQRICIARVIGLRPKLIVCDEITAALDVSVQAQIIELLLKLKDELGLSLLFISHDLSVVKAISTSIHVMYLGKIVESASAKELFANPAHPYTRALLDSIPTLDRSRRPALLEGEVPSPVNKPSGCAFHTRCTKARDKCRVDVPVSEPRTGGHGSAACFYPLTTQAG